MFPLLHSYDYLINDAITYLIKKNKAGVKGIVASNMKINDEYVTLILKYKTNPEIAANKYNLLDMIIRSNNQNDVLVYLGSKTIYVGRKDFSDRMIKLNSDSFVNNLYDKDNYFGEFTKFTEKVYGRDKCEKVVQLKDYLLVPYGYPEEVTLKDHTNITQRFMYVYNNDI